MLDQAVFTVTDTAMGIAADKIAAFAGRLGVFVGVVTAISCAAFVALPFVAGIGPGAQAWFIGLILIWVVTSSALRAPPLTLLGKHSARPQIPFLSALAMLGYGLAGAVWSKDEARAQRVARRIRAGQVDVNGGAFNMNAPFGGFKQSGHGREAGVFGLEEFLEYKSLQLKG
jgi:hypothetical protein